MSRQLPKLSDLHQDIEIALKNDELKLLLNQLPSESFLKKHPTVNSVYLPIDKVELLMDIIFQEWKVEVLREGVMFNSVYVAVRVHYKNPITGEWSFHDGVGAKDIQLDKDSKASDMANIKAAGVMMSLPIAKSQAIKDACDHFGKLFGRDLNRKNTIEFVGKYEHVSPSQSQMQTLNTTDL
jgi:hypothetical protein